MRRITLILACSLLLSACLAASALALDISPDELEGTPTHELEVVSPPAPGLVGCYSGNDCRSSFAYCLVNKDGRLALYTKWQAGTKRGEGWESGIVDGDALRIGAIKVWVNDDGEVYRAYKGKYKYRLMPMH